MAGESTDIRAGVGRQGGIPRGRSSNKFRAFDIAAAGITDLIKIAVKSQGIGNLSDLIIESKLGLLDMQTQISTNAERKRYVLNQAKDWRKSGKIKAEHVPLFLQAVQTEDLKIITRPDGSKFLVDAKEEIRGQKGSTGKYNSMVGNIADHGERAQKNAPLAVKTFQEYVVKPLTEAGVMEEYGSIAQTFTVSVNTLIEHIGDLNPQALFNGIPQTNIEDLGVMQSREFNDLEFRIRNTMGHLQRIAFSVADEQGATGAKQAIGTATFTQVARSLFNSIRRKLADNPGARTALGLETDSSKLETLFTTINKDNNEVTELYNTRSLGETTRSAYKNTVGVAEFQVKLRNAQAELRLTDEQLTQKKLAPVLNALANIATAYGRSADADSALSMLTVGLASVTVEATDNYIKEITSGEIMDNFQRAMVVVNHLTSGAAMIGEKGKTDKIASALEYLVENAHYSDSQKGRNAKKSMQERIRRFFDTVRNEHLVIEKWFAGSK